MGGIGESIAVGMSEPVAVSVDSKTGIAKTSISVVESSIGENGVVEGRGVVNERGRGSQDSGGSTEDGRVSLTPLPLSSGGSSWGSSGGSSGDNGQTISISMETGISKTSISKTSISKPSISKTSVSKTSVGKDRGVVDEGSWGSQDSAGSSNDGGISITPLPLSRGSLGSLYEGKVSSSGLSDLRGVLYRLRGNSSVNRGNQGLRVEFRGNSIIDGCNGQPGVGGSKAEGISNIGDLLELTVGVNIAVTTADTTVGVSDLVLDGIEVAIAVVQVAKLVLGMELASDCVGCSVRSVGSSIGSSVRGVASVGEGVGLGLG